MRRKPPPPGREEAQPPRRGQRLCSVLHGSQLLVPSPFPPPLLPCPLEDREGTGRRRHGHQPRLLSVPAHHQLVLQDGRCGPRRPTAPRPGPPPLVPGSALQPGLCSPGPPYVCLKMLPQPHDVFTPSCLLLSQFDTWWEEEMGLRGAVANCTGGGKFRHNCSGPAAPAAWGAGAGTGRAASSWSTDATEQRLRVPLRPAPAASSLAGPGRAGLDFSHQIQCPSCSQEAEGLGLAILTPWETGEACQLSLQTQARGAPEL